MGTLSIFVYFTFVVILIIMILNLHIREYVRDLEFVQTHFAKSEDREDINRTIRQFMEAPRIIVIRNVQEIETIEPTEPVVEIPDNLPQIERTNMYYEQLQDHANDSQNVHDPSINISLIRKYDRLLELIPDQPLPKIPGAKEKTIKKYIELKTIYEISSAAHITRPDIAAKVDAFLDASRNNYTTSSLESKLVQESNLLRLVWARINHKDNINNRQNLLETFLISLSDAIDKYGSSVCSGGRAARILECFTLLDADSVLAAPELDETEVTNLAYMQANAILNRELQKDDIRRIYNSVTHTPEELRVLQNFANSIKLEIEKECIRLYSEYVGENKLREIIKSAQAGIEI